MRKGFFASVAALAAGAGVAFGQGSPSAPTPPAPGYPAALPGFGGMPGPGGPGGPPAGEAGFYGGPGGSPAGPASTDVPPASDMPLTGQVPGPNCDHPYNPACPPKCGKFVGQIHKAAGGPDRWWIDIEENVWTVRPETFNFPLVTISPIATAGAVGVDGTKVLVGEKNFDYGDYFNVFRLTGGVWDCNRVCGFEASGFISESRSENFFIEAPGNVNYVIARPFINALNGQPSSLLVSFPGQFTGTATVNGHIHFGGAEANALRSLLYCDQVKLNLLAGIRYVDLSEDLSIASSSFFPNPADPFTPFITSTVADSFNTHNRFFGAQVGAEAELRRGRWFVDMTGKIAVGDMEERVTIGGATNTTAFGASTVVPGGLLALVSNSGRSTRSEFAYVPEGTIKFGYQWTQRISTYIGANGLYLSRVARPGEQIDPVVNPTLVPVSTQFGSNFGPARPLPTFRQTDFWALGAVIGLSIRY
jgi:hypothetical protein